MSAFVTLVTYNDSCLMRRMLAKTAGVSVPLRGSKLRVASVYDTLRERREGIAAQKRKYMYFVSLIKSFTY
ncbi:hypothetical protein [Nostoc sp.]|uniref:hypothetical protein n=1 Tax=Nostoc sp. TaxID=1180 RepID=UPI002FFAEB7F